MINIDDIQTENPKMNALIQKALLKESKNKRMKVSTNVLVPEVDRVAYNKYGVSEKEDRTYSDGTLFASKTEMERYDYLLKLQRAGEIKNLQSQVDFILLEPFVNEQYGKIHHIVYVADFVYTNISFRKGLEGVECVEDSKTGVRTKEYKIKRKWFLFKYGYKYKFFEV